MDVSISACTLNTLILTKTKVELPPSLGWLGISLAGPQAKQKVLSLMDDVPSWELTYPIPRSHPALSKMDLRSHAQGPLEHTPGSSHIGQKSLTGRDLKMWGPHGSKFRYYTSILGGQYDCLHIHIVIFIIYIYIYISITLSKNHNIILHFYNHCIHFIPIIYLYKKKLHKLAWPPFPTLQSKPFALELKTSPHYFCVFLHTKTWDFIHPPSKYQGTKLLESSGVPTGPKRLQLLCGVWKFQATKVTCGRFSLESPKPITAV